MRVWLAIQFLAGLLGIIAGTMVAMTAKSAIHEIEAMLLVGFSALTMAVIGCGAVADDKAERQEALLREIRDRLPRP